MSRKISLRRIISLLLLSLIVLSFLPADARVNASLVEFVTGLDEDLNLFILNKDLEVDLAQKSARLRMLMDAESLMVRNSYPQSFKVRTFSFSGGNQEVLHSELVHTIKRRNRTKVRFTLDLGYVDGDKDFYFEVYDSANRLVNTYRQTIDFSNLQQQVYDTTAIAAADCDNTTFNDCHLDYIMDKIDFLLEPKNTHFSNKVKNPNGKYSVVLSIPKSVREQVLKGDFGFQALGGLGGGTGNGDNLGNHMATQNLDMKTFDIENVGKITAQELMVMNGTSLQDLVVNGKLQIVDGANNGYVLMSDANGNATWQSLSVIVNGDNLGNHIATQNLDMNNFSVTNADLLDAEALVLNGSFAFLNGAAAGKVLTSDVNGNASWQTVNTVVNGDGLGNHVADMKLDMNGHNIVAAMRVNADTLIANTLDVTTVDVGAQIHSPTLTGAIDIINGTLSIPTGAGVGKVLTSDANGDASWQTPSGGGNGDNLGNHTATTNLNMSGNDIGSVRRIDVTNGFSLLANAGTDRILRNIDINGEAMWDLPEQYQTTVLSSNGGGLLLDFSVTPNYIINVSSFTQPIFVTAPAGHDAKVSVIYNIDATGGYTLAAPAGTGVIWKDGSTPTIDNVANRMNLIECYFTQSANKYLCEHKVFH